MEQKCPLLLLCHIFRPKREKNLSFLLQNWNSKGSRRGGEKIFLFFTLSDFSSQRREKLSLCVAEARHSPFYTLVPSIRMEMGFHPFLLDPKTAYYDLLKLGDCIIQGILQFLPRRFYPCLEILPGIFSGLF